VKKIVALVEKSNLSAHADVQTMLKDAADYAEKSNNTLAVVLLGHQGIFGMDHFSAGVRNKTEMVGILAELQLRYILKSAD
jgi:hypothetical protein